MIRVELENDEGKVDKILEFPDGTDQSVIDTKVKEVLSGGASQPGEFGPPTEDHVPGGAGGSFEKEETFTEQIPRMAGATALGIGASVAGAPLLAASAAAGLGGGAGEAFRQIGQHLSGDPDAPKTSVEAAKRIAQVAAEEAGFEMMGGLAAKGFNRMLSPYKKSLEKGAREVIDFFSDKIKPVLLPAEASSSRVIDLLHNIAESSLVGGNKISKFKTNRSQFFDDFADSLIDQFGQRTDPSDLGNLFVEAVKNNQRMHKEASELLYKTVDDMVGSKIKKVPVKKMVPSDVLGPDGRPVMKEVVEWVDKEISPVKIPTERLKKFAAPLSSKAEDLGSIEAKNSGDDLINAVMNLPDTLTFDAARELRSRLLSRVDEFSVINKKAPAIGKAKKLISILDNLITKGLKDVEPKFASKDVTPLEAWRIANKFYKNGQEKFNNTLIRRLIKLADDTGTGAEMIAPAVFKPGRVSTVRKVKRALANHPDTWKKMQGFFVQHLLSKSTDAEGNLVGRRLINNMYGKPHSFGSKMLREILSPDQIKALDRLGTALKLTQARQSEGAGRVLIQLTQAGAIGALLAGNMDYPAAVVVIGPAVLSRMMLNPATAKLITSAATLPANSKNAAALLARIIAAYHRTAGTTESKQRRNTR